MTDRNNYGADIDGLRAVAVLSVIFFHLEIDAFSGGFVGVDVFFVISGFLITRLLVADMSAGTWAPGRFYTRRARRLFPALFVTLAATLACGALLFSPQHFARLGHATLYATAAMSNLFFWSEAGYFDTARAFKPLLHTWSLSVEEQFYLLWPLLLLGIHRVNRAMALPTLLLAGALSVYYGEKLIDSHPDAVFFLLPFRVVEFSIGAACLWLTRRPGPEWVREASVVAGLGMIAYAVFGFSEETPFPGLHALVPCLGAALVIYGGTAPVAGRLLRNRSAVAIGLISYSLYLCHWPLIVFFKYVSLSPLTPVHQAGLLLASLALGTAMYFFVEQPFRLTGEDRRRLRPAAFGLACVGLALGLALVASHAWQSHGWPWRVPEEIRNAIDHREERQLESWNAVRARGEEPFPGPAGTSGVLIGDSQAKDLFNALEQNGPRLYLKLLQIATRCQPFVGRRPFTEKLRSRQQIAECGSDFDAILASPDLARSDFVLLAANWKSWSIRGLPRTLEAIEQRTKGRIIVFGPRMKFGDVPTLVHRHGRLAGLESYVNGHQIREQLALNRQMKEALGDRVLFVDLFDALCPGGVCPVLTEERELIYFDAMHWTLPGAAYLGRSLRDRRTEITMLLFRS